MIRSLLIANRGEISERIQRTATRLGLSTVAVYSDADADLHFTRMADTAVRIGAPPPGESYLNIEAILEAARKSGADAVHPGYGFLSERAVFAAAVLDAGLTWIGPSPEAIRAMGDKSKARQLAHAHDVPTVPGYDGEAQDADTFATEAARIGFPVLIKAAAGGGGRGMRRVDDASELPAALDSARREAESAFGDGTLLLEKLVVRPRHIEVQVFGDTHGNVVHLGERECSIQRRHQKIIEEAPSPAVTPELREAMGAAAVRLASAVGYAGAGTAEFLLDADGHFYFLEMNTRLQVEHCVTEEVTGVDLVEWQLRVAAGEPLPLTQEQITLTGHSIESRLYAEDPNRDYLPATGPLHRVALAEGPGLRNEVGYRSGDAVGIHYDAMLAKLVATGPSRAVATQRMARAVRLAWVPGVVTNLPLLREIYAHPMWNEGDLDTAFLGRAGLPTPPPLNLLDGALAVTALGLSQRASSPWPAPSGWRLGGVTEEHDRLVCGDQEVQVHWTSTGPAAARVRVVLPDGTEHAHQVTVLERDGDTLQLDIDGMRQSWRTCWLPAAPHRSQLDDGDTVYVHTGRGEAFLQVVPRFPPPKGAEAPPGSCICPTPGTVTAVHVEVGQQVTGGQRLLTIEAMKMEHAITAPEDGTVAQIRVAVGDTVDEGELLVQIDGDDSGDEG